MSVIRMIAVLLTGALLLSALPACAEENPLFPREMVERSLISVGNAERIQRAIAKAQNGEDVSIVYLGGSITEGSAASPQKTQCYAYLSAQIFADKFMADKSRLKYHNAGISGTPSLLGVTRCEKDVLAHQPDIVFVEFAVNDSTDLNSRMVYESLICKLLESETAPAVMLIFTLTSNGYSCQEHMQKVGKHYKLGMISIRDAVQAQRDAGLLAWTDYSPDDVHPNNAGHAFMADCIGYYFDQAAAAESEAYTLPRIPIFGRTLATLRNVLKDDPAIVNPGMFDVGAVNCYNYKQGWRHMSNRNDQGALTLQLDATVMTIVYKQENNALCGTAEIWVDGKCKAKLNSNSAKAWGNPVTEMIFLGKSDEPHTVEIRMAEGNEYKLFNLLDIGFAK